MPYTLNGIGTRYYGRRNASQANGTCQSCNRWVALSSYDTRECFCLLFIPVIPLRRAFAALAAALGGRGSDEDALRAARHGHFMRLKDAYFLTSARPASTSASRSRPRSVSPPRPERCPAPLTAPGRSRGPTVYAS
jgi:hypothetical protein